MENRKSLISSNLCQHHQELREIPKWARLVGRVRQKKCQFGAKNDTAPKLGGMIHYTIRNKFRTGAIKNLQWTHDFCTIFAKWLKILKLDVFFCNLASKLNEMMDLQ